MASIQSNIIQFWFRHGKLLANAHANLQQQRARMEQAQRLFKVHQDVQINSVSADSVPAEWCVPPGASADACLMYIHGGAWFMGSPRTHRGMVSYISYESSIRALSIDYRLAPEHPFPAGLDDCLTAYQWLLENGTTANKIILAGDSAGGNLTLALLVLLRDQGLPLPAGAVALSPATDLTGSSESYITRRHLDPVLTNLEDTSILRDYLGDHDPHDPYISPLFADLHGLPPILIHVGDHEVLLDDARRFTERAQEAGVDAQVVVWPGMFHVFQIFVPWLPEAKQAVAEIAKFIKLRLSSVISIASTTN
jgi:monoterpene epsilon-lactone hydrolase